MMKPQRVNPGRTVNIVMWLTVAACFHLVIGMLAMQYDGVLMPLTMLVLFGFILIDWIGYFVVGFRGKKKAPWASASSSFFPFTILGFVPYEAQAVAEVLREGETVRYSVGAMPVDINAAHGIMVVTNQRVLLAKRLLIGNRSPLQCTPVEVASFLPGDVESVQRNTGDKVGRAEDWMGIRTTRVKTQKGEVIEFATLEREEETVMEALEATGWPLLPLD